MAKQKIIICGNYGVNNLGDEAILRALVEKISKDHDLIIMSANPKETTAKLKVIAVNRMPSGLRSYLKILFCPITRKEFKKTKEALKNSDKFILGGGTLLTDEPKASMLVWGSQVRAAFKYNNQLEVYANGVGPLSSKWSRKVAAIILNKAAKITVRDELSQNLVKKLIGEKVEIIKDPVLTLKINPINRDRLNLPKETIILSPRFWKSYSKNTENVLKKFVHYLCVEKGKYMVGIPFEKYNKKDIQMMNKIFDQKGVRNRSQIYNSYQNEEDVLSAIKEAELLIGMRLHSLIFAHLVKTPFIGLAYMEKVRALGQELKLPEKILPLEGLTVEKIKKVYESSVSKVS